MEMEGLVWGVQTDRCVRGEGGYRCSAASFMCILEFRKSLLFFFGFGPRWT